jgi:hypothetical protein
VRRPASCKARSQDQSLALFPVTKQKGTCVAGKADAKRTLEEASLPGKWWLSS